MSSTKSNPLLTIIMPTYNSAATLDVALKSIIHQTFQNIEVLIIDGLSSDDTIAIAKKYQLEFPQIKIISEADKGIYDAMNKGIGIAKGEWVYFMGGDDSLFAFKTLEKIFGIRRFGDVDVIYGDVYAKGFKRIYDGEFTFSKLATKNICHQAIFFRKNVFQTIGKFNTKYIALADWDHNIEWFFSSQISRLYISQTIANYAEGGFSAVNDDEQFYKDKNLKLFKKGIGKISISQLVSISRNGLLYSKRDNSFIMIGFWTITLNSFLLVRRVLRNKRVTRG